jgi:hypothetical protein
MMTPVVDILSGLMSVMRFSYVDVRRKHLFRILGHADKARWNAARFLDPLQIFATRRLEF